MRTGFLIAASAAAVAWAAFGSSTPEGDAVPGANRPAERQLQAGPEPAGPITRLKRAVRPQRAINSRVHVTIGRSREGRPITATAVNGIGDGQNARSNGPLVLAVGCIHGDECAGKRVVAYAQRGCPPLGDGVVIVPNLNPDGRALGTRLNAARVDLNRNFSSDWRPIGVPGDPEHSGPEPFSEPETRIARRLVERLQPDVTIWFHQQQERLVRAWGPSIPAARAYAQLAGEPFSRLPWLAGTAPNWQNHHFPGTSSFVVELPLDGAQHPDKHGVAIAGLAGELG